MSTSSQSLSGVNSAGYEPRYQVGDLIRDGLGATCKITGIRRASGSDGHSDIRAVQEGFTTYECRRLSDGYRSVLTTSFLHHMVDTEWRLWAYLGPASPETSDAATGGAS